MAQANSKSRLDVKLKRKMRTIRKEHDGERYTFRDGVAKVPGCWFQGKPMVITIEEFDELSRPS